MPFFTTTADFKKYCSVNASFKIDELLLFLREVDRTVLKKYIGAEFLAELQTAFDGNILGKEEPTADELKTIEAIEMIRRCTPHFAVANWIPTGQVQIDNSGIRIASNENYKTAFQWQVRDLQGSLKESGVQALDDLLEYLDSDLDFFTTYKDSAEFKSNKELFVSSSLIFAKYYGAMVESRVNFYRLKSIVRKVEDFDIKGVLLPDYYQFLKDQLIAGTALEAADLIILNMIQPAVVNLTISRAVNELAANISKDGFLIFDNTAGRDTNESKKQAGNDSLLRMAFAAEKDGCKYLDDLKVYLEANKVNYPDYTGDATYVEPDTSTIPNDGSINIYNGL